MIGNRSLPSAPPGCLERAYPSSQKGGTIVVEWVCDLETHEELLCEPERYRPETCGRCGAAVHLHDVRSRQLRGDPAGSTEVIRFRCADLGRCGATWLILPLFLARHLWRSWKTVAAADLEGPLEGTRSGEVPASTRRRWKSRLGSSARRVISVLTTGSARVSSFAAVLGLDVVRADLLGRYRREFQADRERSFSELASLLHRLSPGIRLM